MATKYKLEEDFKQGNKEIAKFLGGGIYHAYTFKTNKVYGWQGTIVEKYRELVKLPIIDTIMIHDLEFHTDWNALMWVIEKIEGRGFKVLKGFDNSFQIIKIEKGKAEIVTESTDFVTETIDDIFKAYTKVPDTKIHALWWCIVKFIRGYVSNR